MSSAFPFKAARPKGAKPQSFEMPPPPPAPIQPFKHEEPAISVEEQIALENRSAEANAEVEQALQETEETDVAKRGRGRPRKQAATPKPRERSGPKFTFAEVAEVFGDDVPFVKVISRIVPVIEVLSTADRKKVVDILSRLYG